MEKIEFLDPETNEIVEFAVEEETQLNGIKYLLVSDGQEEEELLYQMVEDDVEFAALAKVFSELTDEETTLEY